MTRRLISSILVGVATITLNTAGAFAAANKVPTVTAFDVAANSASPVPVVTFTATDIDGTVTGYLITESDVRPAAVGPNWSPTPPTSYTTFAVGPSVRLHAWAKDNANAVSTTLKYDTVNIPAPAINADTLDGIDSTGFAAAVHDHDGVYQKKYANVVVVAKSRGDFTDPCLAVASITDASASNPYLVKIMPGIYDLGSGALTMKEYVDIEGSGENTTIITGIGDPSTVNGASNTEIRLLTVRSTGGGVASYAIANFGVVSIKITNVTAIASAGYIRSASIMNYTSTVIMDNVTIDTSAGGYHNYISGVFNADGSSVTLKHCNIIASGSDAAGYVVGIENLESSVVTMIDVLSVARNGEINWNRGLYNNGSAFIDHSRIEGDNSVFNFVGIVRIGASRLVGSVISSGQTTCVSSYDGSYAPLDSACQ